MKKSILSIISFAVAIMVFISILLNCFLFTRCIKTERDVESINRQIKELSLDTTVARQITELTSDVYSTYGKYNKEKYNGFISKANYKALCYREKLNNIVREENTANLKSIKFSHNKAIAKYSYVYAAFDKNNEVLVGDGSEGEPIIQTIKLKKKDDKWMVIAIDEDA